MPQLTRTLKPCPDELLCRALSKDPQNTKKYERERDSAVAQLLGAAAVSGTFAIISAAGGAHQIVTGTGRASGRPYSIRQEIHELGSGRQLDPEAIRTRLNTDKTLLAQERAFLEEALRSAPGEARGPRPGEAPATEGRPTAQEPVTAPSGPKPAHPEVFEGITPETAKMLRENPELRASLDKFPEAAKILKLCHSNCWPEFFNKLPTSERDRILGRLQRFRAEWKEVRKSYEVGEEYNEALMRRTLHDAKSKKELESLLDGLEDRVARVKARSPEATERAEVAGEGVPTTEEGGGTGQMPRQKSQVATSHQAGVEGGKKAARRDGIDVENWNNPRGHIHEYGRGIDALGRRGNDRIILEWKGEGSPLTGDQMRNSWVGRKLAELQFENDPIAQELLAAARSGHLKGRIYRTRIEPGGKLSPALEGNEISYDYNAVYRAYRRRLAELRRRAGL